MKKRLHRVAYYGPSKGDGWLLQALRDGASFFECSSVLARQGYQPGEQFLNYPPLDRVSPKTVDLSNLSGADILILANRPPDTETNCRKTIEPGKNNLEDRIFDVLNKYFVTRSRCTIELTSHCWQHLKDQNPEKLNRAKIKFRQYMGEEYVQLFGVEPPFEETTLQNCQYTAGYFLYEKEIWPGGPSLIVSFSMSGPYNLIFNRMVKVNYADLFNKPGFTMIEIEKGEIPEQPSDLSFADSWNSSIIFSHDPI